MFKHLLNAVHTKYMMLYYSGVFFIHLGLKGYIHWWLWLLPLKKTSHVHPGKQLHITLSDVLMLFFSLFVYLDLFIIAFRQNT